MMNSIMNRSFAQHMGFKWRSDVACLVNGKAVTWREVHDRRRERQARILEWKRRVPEPLIAPCYLWTFFNSGFIYYGWYCYVVTLHDEIAVNFRGFNEHLARSIMEAVPVGMLPVTENFERWMKKFAKTHPRKHPRDRRRAGSVVGWLTTSEYGTAERFTLDRPR